MLYQTVPATSFWTQFLMASSVQMLPNDQFAPFGLTSTLNTFCLMSLVSFLSINPNFPENLFFGFHVDPNPLDIKENAVMIQIIKRGYLNSF